LRLGDTLLLLAEPGFGDRWHDRPDFLLVSAGDAAPKTDPRRATLVGAITVAMVVAAGSGAVPILHASLVAAVALLVLGCLSIHEARSAVEVDVLIVIAASFGVGAAVEKSGLAAAIGAGIVGVAMDFGWRGALAAVLLATVVLTEFISNNAAAALMFPIALATAADVGADPRHFAIAVAIAASCSFLTPVGYQTNTMVYGPGGYRFGDYWRLGGPLTVLVVVWLVASA
jgi:di/tricarboxylate transporter